MTDRQKANWVGAPACFELELALYDIRRAFGSCYQVGSSLHRADFRDVDIRCIMPDEEFDKLFPGLCTPTPAGWEHDSRWLVMTTTISQWLSTRIGKTVDFQFQRASWANEHHSSHEPRHYKGFRRAPSEGE